MCSHCPAEESRAIEPGPSDGDQGRALSRFEELDVFRGFAALAVVLHHYCGHYQRYFGNAEMPVEFLRGQYGVQLFFMISGFVILMTLQRSRTGWDFAFSRFFRLYPAYWGTVIFTSAVTWLTTTYPFWLRGFVVNMTMLQAYLGFPDYDRVFWSLAVELGFYAIMLGIFLTGGLARIESIALAWLGLMVVVEAVARWLGAELPQPVALLIVAKYANLFISGMMFYRWHRGVATKRTVLILAACLLVELFVHGLESGLFIAGFFVLFMLAENGWLTWLCVRPLLWLGAISYSLYLLHRNTGYLVLNTLHAVGAPTAVTMLATLGVALGLAAVFTWGIERPALKAFRQWYRWSRANNRQWPQC